MTIYLEYAILDNMVINILLLWFVFRTIKQKTPKLRVFISALVGTAAALVMPLLTFGGVLALLIKLFVGAAMVFIVQSKSLARFTVFYLLFLVYTFAFGGAMYGIMSMWGIESLSVGGFLVIGLVAYKLLSTCIKFLNLRHSVNNYLRDIVIHYKDEKFRVTSYLDTGNRLVDPETRAPVVIISLSLFLKMFPEVSIDRVFLNKLTQAGIDDGRYIDFSTVDRNSKMFTFTPQKFEIVEGKKSKACENVRLGVSMRGFKDAIKYDALLNANLGVI